MDKEQDPIVYSSLEALRKRRAISSGELVDLIAADCWSLFEGCACHEPAGHEGLHECGSEGCDTTWTTAEGDEWVKQFAVAQGFSACEKTAAPPPGVPEGHPPPT